MRKWPFLAFFGLGYSVAAFRHANRARVSGLMAVSPEMNRIRVANGLEPQEGQYPPPDGVGGVVLPLPGDELLNWRV